MAYKAPSNSEWDALHRRRSAVEKILDSLGWEYSETGGGDSTYYHAEAPKDGPDDFIFPRATIRVSNHAPPAGRGGVYRDSIGSVGVHEQPAISFHPKGPRVSKSSLVKAAYKYWADEYKREEGKALPRNYFSRKSAENGKKSTRPGGGGRFAKCVKQTGSAAICASAGRKKYGAAQMAKWAAAARKKNPSGTLTLKDARDYFHEVGANSKRFGDKKMTRAEIHAWVHKSGDYAAGEAKAYATAAKAYDAGWASVKAPAKSRMRASQRSRTNPGFTKYSLGNYWFDIGKIDAENNRNTVPAATIRAEVGRQILVQGVDLRQIGTTKSEAYKVARKAYLDGYKFGKPETGKRRSRSASRRRNPAKPITVASLRLSRKDPMTMTAAQISKEQERLSKQSTEITDAFIEAGRGHETKTDSWNKQDNLSKADRALTERLASLRAEVEARMGPGYARFPTGVRGFGPRKRNGRRANPESAAFALHDSFNQTKGHDVTTYVENIKTHSWLAGLALLDKLIIDLDNGKGKAEIKFPETKAGAVQLCASEDGKQLYFKGGNQSIPLKTLGFDDVDRRDNMVIGSILKLHYIGEKGMHDFETIEYHHKLGEETGHLPVLLYDPRNRRLSVAGGRYVIKPEGIVN